ncbi:hypothetical protein [Halorubrum sp. CSM-61]|uniref:DUF7576 family protein n=1 Tax=Halorubrum sp. CSM-61 TaxID=2485838 RepID=UPI000F4BCF0A|nr:hypothetical protein [Halorubrum sp. CSM-61]
MAEGDSSAPDDPSETGGEATEATRCATCGARIGSTAWHPVAARFDDGEFTLYAFCSIECREEWNRP